MSGICGIVHFSGEPVDAAVLRKMAEAASHRAPDGIQYLTLSEAGFAHLAHHITPESVHEKQPLLNSEDKLILAADARVDNRDDLICTLTASGHLAADDPSDADLILAAYRRWGEDCGARILGDFAFAIWDGARRCLFAARDPMGLRPLYYRVESDRVVFASEVKQILALPDVPARIFEPAVAAHLAGPLSRPEWTFYEGIVQLPPSHLLLAETRGHSTRRYWDIDPSFEIRYRDENEYVEHLRELLEEAVRCRIRSVKPVGVSLSGGMDSGSIAATAGLLLQRNRVDCPAFRAYCYAFEELPHCDERHISDGITRHYEIPVTDVPADESWPLKDHPAHGPDRDDPFVGVYQALMDQTIEAARKDQVAVLLSGERGDEMMGTWIYDEPGLLRAGQWSALWEEMRVHHRLSGMSLQRIVKARLLTPLLSPLHSRARRHLRAASSVRNPPWVRTEFAKKAGLPGILHSDGSNFQTPGFARGQRYAVIFSPISTRRVTWLERSQARFGVGFADPWSDRRIATFVLAIPQWVVNRIGDRKRLIRRAMRGVMPEAARNAVRKTEPRALFDSGLKERAKETVLGLMTNSVAARLGYLQEDALRNCYESYLRGEPLKDDFWWPLSLEMWLREYWTEPRQS